MKHVNNVSYLTHNAELTTEEAALLLEGSSCVSRMSEADIISSEVEVNSLFLENPDDYVSKSWMMDLFGKNKLVVDIEQHDVDSIIDSFLDTLALLGVDAEVTILGEA